MKTLIRIARSCAFFTIAAILLVGSPGKAHALYYADAPYLQYGDFQSYALGLLNYDVTGDEKGTNGPSGIDYSIPSTPGAIKDVAIVLYSAPGNQDLKNNESSSINDPFDSVGGVGGGTYFSTSMTAFPDPGTLGNGSPDVVNGTELTWDITTAALKDYLDGGNLVFYFNNNQTGKTLETISLWAYGQIELVDLDGVADTLYFDFVNNAYAGAPTYYLGGIPNGDVETYSNSYGNGIGVVGQPDTFVPGAYAGPTAGPDAITPSNYAEYVFVRGELCFADVDTPVDCSQPHAFKINTNLGANEAAFSLFSPELQAWLDDVNSPYDILRADFRLATLNNGYEQLFILATPGDGPPPVIPEPSTIVLLLTGICGLFVYQRRRRNP
jgi:hypothetical protein